MTLSGNALIMREVNTQLVRRSLKDRKQATKQQIAEDTGLSIVTVATIVQQLLDSHEILKVEQAPSTGGRPAQQFRFNEDFAHILVLFTHEHEGKDLLHIRVANLYGECISTGDVVLEDIRLETFESWIEAALREYPSIQAIGFGLPGVDVDGKIILLDYPALVGERLTEFYSRRFGLPVIFENDVNAAAAGYCTRHEMQTDAAVIYAYFPKNTHLAQGSSWVENCIKAPATLPVKSAAFPWASTGSTRRFTALRNSSARRSQKSSSPCAAC